MAIRELFPTYLYHTNIFKLVKPTVHRSLLKESYIFRDLDVDGRSWSKENYPAGYTSYSSFDNLMERSPYFLDLAKILNRHAKRFAKSIELENANRLELTSMWVNIMGKFCYHSFHLHPKSIISGTYYLKAPKGCGKFKIEDPRIQCFMAGSRKSSVSVKNQHYYNVSPKSGDLLLFESWLKHEVGPNLSNEDRVSVSFNFGY